MQNQRNSLITFITQLKTALICPQQVDAESGKWLTFAQLKDQTHRLSSGLARKGFKKGDVVALYLPNCLEYPIIIYDS